MRNLETIIPQLIANIKHEIYARPLFLGGTTGSGGGVGGPPGGFIGQLPQSRIAFDLSEEEDFTIPPSGESLVTNLNRIRYRIKTNETNITNINSDLITVHSGLNDLDNRVTNLENNPQSGGIEEVLWEGTTFSTDVKKIDFRGNVVLRKSGDTVTVCVPELNNFYYSGLIGDTLTISGALEINNVFKNGLVLFNDEFTISGTTIKFTTSLVVTDRIVVSCYVDCSEQCNGFGDSNWGDDWGSNCSSSSGWGTSQYGDTYGG